MKAGIIVTNPVPGRLYIVATPIGNLADVSARARETLASVARIAAEDTRRTAVLLKHLGVSTPLESLHEHNERTRSAALVARLASGESIALVSDAGTPAISDPGFELTRAAAAAGIEIIAVPGAGHMLHHEQPETLARHIVEFDRRRSVT